MKTPAVSSSVISITAKISAIISVVLLFLAVSPRTRAASATWLYSPTDGNWEASAAETNWSSGGGAWPGGTSTSSGDTATFTNSTVKLVIVNSTAWNVKDIVFSNASCPSFTITNEEGAASARFTGGGGITISNEVTQPQLITGSQWRLHTGGGLALVNNSATPAATLTFASGIKANNGADATTTDQAVNLQGSNTGANTFGGVIADYGTPTPANEYAAVTKAGTGTWILTAASTYTGPTIVSNGLLILKGTVNDSTNIIVTGPGSTFQIDSPMNLTLADNYLFVTNSGTLQVTNNINQTTTPVTVDNLVISNATLRLGVNGSAPYQNIVASSGLNAGPGVVIDIDQITQVAGPTTFQLIAYGGADPDPADFTVNLAAAYTGYTVSPVSVGGGLVQVTITPPVSTSLVWVGATNNVLVGKWDTVTKDWIDAATLSIPQAYANPDSVQFNDDASNSLVTLTGNVAPQGVGVNNNTLNYVFSGPGLISGPAGLIKQGGASLTLAETGGDDFIGGITNLAGTLVLDDANSTIGGPLTVASGATVQIGNNDNNGSLTGGAVDDEGTLVFDQTGNSLVTAAIAGNGALVQTGSGTVTLNNTNTYYGATVVGAGTLALAGAGTISNSYSITVSNATLDVSGLGGQTALLGTVTVTNATFNVALAGPQPAPAIMVQGGLNADGVVGVSNVINIASLPPTAAYPATITVIQSQGISLANGNFNFALGRLPAASPAYAGYLTESADSTSIQLTLTSGPTGPRSSVAWVGVDYTSLTTNWSDNANWNLPGAPVSTDNVIFNNVGTVGAGTVNNLVDRNFSVASLTYTNVGSGNYHVTDIPAGVTLTVNDFTVGGLSADGAVSDVAFTDAGTLVVNGATFLVGNNGVSTADSGTLLDLSGLSNFVYTAGSGTIDQGIGSRSSANFNLAGVSNSITAATWNANALSVSSTSSGTLTLGAGTNNLNIGAFTIASERGSCTVKFPSGSTGGLRLRGTGGTDTSRATMTLGNRQAGGSGGTTTGTLSFDGNAVDMKLGTLTLGEASGAAANVGTGNLSFDTGVVDATNIDMAIVTLAGATANGTITVGAAGTLVVGSGGLSLVNLNAASGTANGTLTDNGGVIIASNSIVKSTASGTANVSLNGGTLNVVSGTIGTPAAPIDNLTLGGGTLDLNVAMNQTNVVASAITAGGTTVINIGSIAGGSGSTIPLISYASGDPYSSLVLGTIPAGFSNGSLVDDQANSRIDLQITPPATLTWVGAVGSTLNSNWDLTTLDWSNGGTPAAYANPDYVQFGDSASNSTVTLTTTISPGLMTFANNVLNYTLNGSGGISGAVGLVKQGTATLTLDNTGANNYTGGTTVSAGTLQIGSNDSGGSLPAGGVTDNSAVVFDQSAAVTIGNVFSGSGTLGQIGSGTLTLSGNNTNLTGGMTVTNGVLKVTAVTALGAVSATTTITNGGTFDDSAIAFNAISSPRLVVSGAGYANGGAIINSGVAQTAAFSNLTLAASATFGGTGRWDLRAGTGTAASLNESPAGSAYSITKVGTNQVSLVNVGTIDSGLTNIYIEQGELGFQVGTVSPGNPSGSIITSPGAALEVYDLGAPLNKVIVFNGSGTNASFQADAGSAAQNSLVGVVTLNNNCWFDVVSGAFATFGNTIGGAGSLTKVDSGTLTLTNVEAYTGGTTVSNGTLALAGIGAVAASPAITVNAGAVLAVGARIDGTLTVNSGQTLGGAGTVSGSVTNLAGGTVEPSGVLTVATNVTLAGNTVLQLDGTTNTVLAAGGALSYGGTLTLTNVSATPLAAGSTFKLFSAGSYGGAFTSIVTQPALAGGLAWTNNGNGVFSVISLSAPVSYMAISGFSLAGNNLTISGTNAGAGTFYVLMTTNLTQSLNQWVPVATNALSGNGSFSFTATNAANPAAPQSYYILSTTNN